MFVACTAATDNRVVRLRVAVDGTVDGAAQQVVVSGIPKGGIHDGGGLAVGPDGALRGQRLWRVPLAGPGDPGTAANARVRAVAPTPDGTALWVTTSNRDGRGRPAPDDDRILVVPLT